MDNITPGYVVAILILIVIPAIIYVRYQNKKPKKQKGFDKNGFDENGFGE